MPLSNVSVPNSSAAYHGHAATPFWTPEDPLVAVSQEDRKGATVGCHHDMVISLTQTYPICKVTQYFQSPGSRTNEVRRSWGAARVTQRFHGWRPQTSQDLDRCLREVQMVYGESAAVRFLHFTCHVPSRTARGRPGPWPYATWVLEGDSSGDSDELVVDHFRR